MSVPPFISRDKTINPRGTTFRAPTLPLELDGKRLPMRSNPPAIGEGARGLLAGLGYGAGEIDALANERVIVLG